MRNLKRMLCLALTVVMLVGMMVVGVGAVSIDDFGDKAEIQYTDAVALMTELGVFSGATDGSFYPQGTLTREQLAKIAYLLYNTNTDYTIYEGTSTDLGDIANRWSTGAIAWCNANGILVGGTDGNFYPEGTLTVAQTQVTLLRVLGYDNTLSGLTGSKWDINAGILATERGLMKGLTSLKSGDPITREQACQMAFNAIFTKGVVVDTTYNFLTGEIVPTGYKVDSTTGEYTGSTKAVSVFGLTELTGTVGGFETDNEGNVSTTLDATYGTKDSKALTVNVGSDPSLVGCSVTVYATGKGTDADPYTAVYVANNSSVVATIAGEKYGSLVGSSKTYIPNIEAVYVNGKLQTTTDSETNKTVNDTSTTNIKTGSVVELVNTNADSKIEVVRVTNKTVAQLESAPSVDSSTGKVTIAGVVDTAADPATVVGYEDLAAKDVVLYYEEGGVTYLEKAASVTGVVSSKTSAGVYTVGGVAYSTSKLTSTDVSKWSSNFTDAYTFYLDNYNNVVKIEAVDDTVTTTTDYAVVLDFGYEGSAGTTIDSEDTTTWQVKLLFPDGTADIVELATIYKSKDEKESFAPDDDGTFANTCASLKSSYQYKIVSYDESDGAYTLYAEDNSEVSAIKGGLANFDDNLVANSKTVFVVGTGTGAIKSENSDVKIDNLSKVTYTVYTGYSATPDVNADSDNTCVGTALVDSTSGVASLVYVWANKLDDEEETTSLAYIVSTNYTQTSAKSYVYTAVVDGVLTTVTTASTKASDAASDITVGLYECTTASDGVSTLKVKSDATTASAVTAAGNGIVSVTVNSASKTYTYDDDTVVYFIANDSATEIDVTDLADSDYDGCSFILVTTKTGGELLDYVYVVKKASGN